MSVDNLIERMQKEAEFLHEVSSRCAANPQFFQRVITAGIAGLDSKATEADRRAADFETLARIALDARWYKQQESHILALLKKQSESCCIRWDDYIERLSQRIAKQDATRS